MNSSLAYENDIREELIGGEVVAMSPRPAVNHNRVAFRIAYLFEVYLEGKPCNVFSDGYDLFLSKKPTRYILYSPLKPCIIDIRREEAAMKENLIITISTGLDKIDLVVKGQVVAVHHRSRPHQGEDHAVACLLVSLLKKAAGVARNYTLSLDSLGVGIENAVRVMADYVESWDGD